MTTFSLADIQAAAEAKFGHTDIKVSEEETVRLLNALQLPKERRNELFKIQEKLDADDADQEEILAEAIALVAESAEKAKVLLDAIDGNLATLIEVFTSYNTGTQVGEA